MTATALESGLPFEWRRNRGRNGWDSPKDILQDQVAEAMNLVLQKNALAAKRRGSAAQAFTGDSFSGFNKLARFVPGQNDAAAELHFIDRSSPPQVVRVASGTAAAALTLVDAITARPQDAICANLNGKLYYAYKSGVNRLHVFDPSESTSIVRRVGLAAPAAPSVANTGAGSYAATLRRYKVAYRTRTGSDLRRQSELSPATSFTPSGTGTAARVTKPAAINEGETHWVIFGATALIDVWYELAEVAVGTTTYDDSSDPADYNTNEAEPTVGTYALWPSVRFLLSTGDRLVGFGVQDSQSGTTRNGRVYVSPALDTTDTDDDERVQDIIDQSQGWLDLARNAGGEDRGLIGPLDGQILVGQSRGVYLLVPTGDPLGPYRRITLTPTVGFLNQESAFMGEDENGNPCAYWLDEERGPMRYGRNGLEWCGYDVQDVWDRVNVEASNKVAHGLYLPGVKACLWWVACGANNDPSEMIVFFTREGRSTGEDGVRFGWTRWTGDIATARCSCLFARTMGATMSRRLLPYAGLSSKLLRALDGSSVSDDGTAFQGYATSRAFVGERLFTGKTLGTAYVLAPAASGVSIRQSLDVDFGRDSGTPADVLLTADASETRVLRKFEEAEMTEARAFQVTLGDASSVAAHWVLDEWIAGIEQTDEQA